MTRDLREGKSVRAAARMLAENRFKRDGARQRSSGRCSAEETKLLVNVGGSSRDADRDEAMAAVLDLAGLLGKIVARRQVDDDVPVGSADAA